jgi:hypothetical protein
MLIEMDRALHDVLCIVSKCPRELFRRSWRWRCRRPRSIYSANFADNLKSEQLAINESFRRSPVIPKIPRDERGGRTRRICYGEARIVPQPRRVQKRPD